MTEKRIHTKYFITNELGAFLLEVDEIKDCFLVNLRDDFKDEVLLDAHEKQNELISAYETEFSADHEIYGDEDFDWNNRHDDEDYLCELANYIIENEKN